MLTDVGLFAAVSNRPGAKQALIDAGVAEAARWTLESANGISADGTLIVGAGRNPRGNPEAWIARLPAKAASR
jgi:hypothetical protein